MKKQKQNEISQQFLEGSDLQEREDVVLKDASKILNFIPRGLLKRSSWWSSKQIGAFHVLGTYQGKNAVLKIQGIKPTISEIYMIQSFQKNNLSKLVRPPYLYAFLPWDEQKRYEALVLEDVGNTTVVNLPTNESEIEEFYNIYSDYKINCLTNPWIEKSDFTLAEMIENNFIAWKKASFKLYQSHPLRLTSDQALVDKAIAILIGEYQNIEPQFMHGHFSTRDLYKAGNRIVILSNLYWSFRNPWRDAVFAYHWFSYDLVSFKNITVSKVMQQRKLWLDKIHTLPRDEEENKLLNLALLERATAGLNLDALSIDPQLEASEYLVESTRKAVKNLISLF